MSVKTTKYLNEIEAGFRQAIDEVKSLVENTEGVKLNTPEAPGKWHMLQCIEHMSRATEVYVNNVQGKLQNETLPPANAEYKGHWKGRMFARMNAPKPGDEIPMKLKTFKSMEPPQELDSQTVLNRFYEVHEEMISVINKTRSVNIDKIKIATALGPMVKLRIGEAYRFLLAHTQRHMVQLRRIKNTVAA